MNFNSNEAIYLQIADYVCDQIQTANWKEGEKIPSVRELAVLLEVNPNTVMRAYDYLQQQNIIFTKRGLGYFVQANSSAEILKIRRERFIKEELPRLYKQMKMLQIGIPEIETGYDNFNKDHQ